MEQGPVAGILELMTAIALASVAVRHRAPLLALGTRVRRRLFPPPPTPAGRPIELIAVDARRLSLRFRHPPQGLRFAKYEGLRCAYDAVLAEACAAIGAAHLLGVLAPGPELDAERDRVELLLDAYGFRLPDVA